MSAARRLVKQSSAKGFTLVEILIVVIILGILAAIVIPQFTSASDDARKNSLISQVQTLRSQIELFKLQHTNAESVLFGGTTKEDQWEELLKATNPAGSTTIASGEKSYGPYLQTLPVNNVTNKSLVNLGTTVSEASTAVIDANAGFAYNSTTGKFFALDATGRVYLGN